MRLCRRALGDLSRWTSSSLSALLRGSGPIAAWGRDDLERDRARRRLPTPFVVRSTRTWRPTGRASANYSKGGLSVLNGVHEEASYA
jgi:hypothetical protein